MYGITATVNRLKRARRYRNQPVRTGQTDQDKGLAIMDLAIFLLVFVLLMAAASAAGLTADSRDGSDWRPTVDGFRSPPR
jgi:hypothetical protein